ncbi:hypothetical protein [Turicibacter sp.]|uniref:hypothetical protein n=1 Tax=Turicibacter sp. TaxID=2049042 RepID=UPI001B4FA59B|nr:hypothetical protein [Turicibacter sp.]MBP3904129.1 hypothetical protein [Turicibacter sp.]MBP3908538.1 hypothetical protein [Turicibacter sp.]
MQIYKANVSKSIELQQRTCIWLENNKSFENVYQALMHNNELSLKLFHEEILIAVGFTTGSRRRYFNRHCFFIEDNEVIDVTFDSTHSLELREYTVIRTYTFTKYLDAIAYESNKPVNEINFKFI